MLGTSGNSPRVMSPVTAMALPPASAISLATRSAAAPLMSLTTTFALSTISLLLLYGIIVPGMPLLSLSSSVAVMNAGEVEA